MSTPAGTTSARLWAVTYAAAATDPVNKTVPPALVTDGDWLVVGDDSHPVITEHGDWLAARTVGIARTTHAVQQVRATAGSPPVDHDIYYYEYTAQFTVTAPPGATTMDLRVRTVEGVGPVLYDGAKTPGDVFKDPAGHVYPWNVAAPHGTGTTTVNSWITVTPGGVVTAYARVQAGWSGTHVAPPSTVTFHIDARFAEAGTPTLWERQGGAWVQMSDDWAAEHGAMHALDPPNAVAHHARMWQSPPGRWVSIGESAIFDGQNWIRP